MIKGTSPSAQAHAFNQARHELRTQANTNAEVRFKLQSRIFDAVKAGNTPIAAVFNAARFAVAVPGDPSVGISTLKAIGVHPDDAEKLPPRLREIFHGAILAAVACTATYYTGRADARDYLNNEVAKIISDKDMPDATKVAVLEAYRGVIGDTYGDYDVKAARDAVTWEK
jgi:hypothetical protein